MKFSALSNEETLRFGDLIDTALGFRSTGAETLLFGS